MYNRSLALGPSKQLEINIINIRHEIRSIICVFKPLRKIVLCVYHRETNFRSFVLEVFIQNQADWYHFIS